MEAHEKQAKSLSNQTTINIELPPIKTETNSIKEILVETKILFKKLTKVKKIKHSNKAVEIYF